MTCINYVTRGESGTNRTSLDSTRRDELCGRDTDGGNYCSRCIPKVAAARSNSHQRYHDIHRIDACRFCK